jgi:hypothetical protein
VLIIDPVSDVEIGFAIRKPTNTLVNPNVESGAAEIIRKELSSLESGATSVASTPFPGQTNAPTNEEAPKETKEKEHDAQGTSDNGNNTTVVASVPEGKLQQNTPQPL